MCQDAPPAEKLSTAGPSGQAATLAAWQEPRRDAPRGLSRREQAAVALTEPELLELVFVETEIVSDLVQ
jgi:hypothetical protein